MPASDGLVIDLFCGGGGASTGISQALGRSPDVAVDHDADAIAMHTANHPDTAHDTVDVASLSPQDVVAGRPVDLIWASPPCTEHSQAKGGGPKNATIANLAWVVPQWAEAVSPRLIVVENVPPFVQWGPHRSGSTFREFTGRLTRLGYAVRWRILDAADFGAPTHRRRVFVVARRDGPVAWPEPTHGDPRKVNRPTLFGSPRLPWRTAAECIDWSIPCPSIHGRKRPLAAGTMRRIQAGLTRYASDQARPVLVTVNHTDDRHPTRDRSLDRPFNTVTCDGSQALVVPFLVGVGGRAGLSPAECVDEPIGTLTRKADRAPVLDTAYLIKYYGTGTTQPLDEPVGTVTTRDRKAEAVACGDRPDLGLRMLAPRELARMQGFPDHTLLIGSQHSQVARIGNSVCPPVARAIVAANSDRQPRPTNPT